MPISYKVIGNHLKSLRTSASLTQAQVAEYLNIVEVHYGHLERGIRPISLDMLGKLCGLYKVPLDTFLKGSLTDVILNTGAQDTAEAHIIAQINQLMNGCDERTLGLLAEIVDSVVRFSNE